MRALLSALLGALLLACALPEAHKAPMADGGNGGDPGGGGGGTGGAGAVFGNAMWFKNACASATPRATMDLEFATAAFTVEFWYRPNNLPANGEYQVLIAKGGSNMSIPGWTIFIGGAARGAYLALSTSNTSESVVVGTAAGAIVAGDNYHFVVWRKQDEAGIWLLQPSHGQIAHEEVKTGMAVPGWVGDEPFALGALRTDSGCDLDFAADGVLDEVRIFSREVPQAEFNADYKAPISPRTNELAAYFQMDEENGNAMADSVEPARQLTLSGTIDVDYEWVASPFSD
ncbi:MAG TPA: LamG-like jellyroll fold domain-containing protein [Polyangiaceae bacterium]|nr:LamG-like jellyroll fold domain-containing protein [Polyangiaceae bacterium]